MEKPWLDGFGEGTDQDEGAAGMAALRNPEALLNGSGPAVPKAETRTSRVGTILSEVSAAMQGVVKASSGVRVQVQRGNRGASSVGTEGTAGTGGSGYATAVSEAEGNDLPPGAVASGRDSREPLFFCRTSGKAGDDDEGGAPSLPRG